MYLKFDLESTIRLKYMHVRRARMAITTLWPTFIPENKYPFTQNDGLDQPVMDVLPYWYKSTGVLDWDKREDNSFWRTELYNAIGIDYLKLQPDTRTRKNTTSAKFYLNTTYADAKQTCTVDQLRNYIESTVPTTAERVNIEFKVFPTNPIPQTATEFFSSSMFDLKCHYHGDNATSVDQRYSLLLAMLDPEGAIFDTTIRPLAMAPWSDWAGSVSWGEYIYTCSMVINKKEDVPEVNYDLLHDRLTLLLASGTCDYSNLFNGVMHRPYSVTLGNLVSSFGNEYDYFKQIVTTSSNEVSRTIGVYPLVHEVRKMSDEEFVRWVVRVLTVGKKKRSPTLLEKATTAVIVALAVVLAPFTEGYSLAVGAAILTALQIEAQKSGNYVTASTYGRGVVIISYVGYAFGISAVFKQMITMIAKKGLYEAIKTVVTQQITAYSNQSMVLVAIDVANVAIPMAIEADLKPKIDETNKLNKETRELEAKMDSMATPQSIPLVQAHFDNYRQLDQNEIIADIPYNMTQGLIDSATTKYFR